MSLIFGKGALAGFPESAQFRSVMNHMTKNKMLGTAGAFSLALMNFAGTQTTAESGKFAKDREAILEFQKPSISAPDAA